ncbi:MAG TPA: hypothetical protein DCZ69_18980 [Syntrophobacteraceae bacterium]|nr:hypothetical protein [Syntrophobacteraceae bacterium]
MAQNKSAFWLTFVCTSLTTLSLLASPFSTNSAHALTASIGQPYRGHLVNGVPFPAQFHGYYVREDSKSYGTPELIGAVLDAIEKVQAKYPNTADLFVGDISGPQGGRLRHHRSHENGRDIDLGMYAKDNSPLRGFACMSEDNLDAAKTWELVENLLRSRRVQYIFLDNSVQRLLYQFALSQGTDRAFLDQLFGVAGNQNARTVIQHMRGHRDHIHVRFYAPWSTLAGQLASLTEKQRDLIELAQGAYVPKKVNYYVQGNESGLPALAASFGVTTRDLCRWNQLHGSEILTPGACLTFYKRGFEVEPVRLAQSLQPNTGLELPAGNAARRGTPSPVQLASLQEELGDVVTDAEDQPIRVVQPDRGVPDRRAPAKPAVSTHSVRKGESLATIAKRNKIDVDTLCRLNGLKKNSKLSAGQKLKVPGGNSDYAVAGKSGTSKRSVAKADSRKVHDRTSGKHGKIADSGKGKRHAAAKGKDTRTASHKNVKSDKKPADKKTVANAATRKSGKDAHAGSKVVAGKQSDRSKGKTQTATSKVASANSKKSAQPAKKEVSKPASKPTANQKKGSSTSVAANNAGKAKKRM